MNYLYKSDFFKIDEVEIEKNLHYTDEEVMEHIPGLLGSNIFEIDMQEIEQELEGSLSWLEKADIEREFPRKIRISFTERQEYVLTYNRGKYFLLDEEGVVIEIIDREGVEQYEDLLIVKKALDYSPELGEKIAKKSILSCGKIYQFMDPSIKEKVAEAIIDDDGFGSIIFVTIDDMSYVYGDSEYLTEKNAVLKQILNNLSKENQDYSIIDISDYQSPVIR